MQKRTRIIILFVCIVLFLGITPYLILYSLGYRLDFKNFKMTATGGIYVRAEQSGSEVSIDSEIGKKSSFFSNSIFVQNLLPQEHIILVKKDGYFDYRKNIIVKEKEVTKIENITLFKNNIAFEKLDKNLAENLFPDQLPPKKNVIAYTQTESNIIWLGFDGNLNQSDIDGKNNQILTSSPILISKNGIFKIFSNNFGIFILKNKDLLVLNKNTGAFDFFLANVNDLKISPDGQNIFYATNNEIWLDHSNYEYNQNQNQNKSLKKILLNKFYENISDIFWLNNNYLILKADNPSNGSGQVKITEIDNRGNINIVDLTLPADFSLNTKSQIYFNQSDKKLYILNNNNLISSEKLLP